MTLSPRNFFLLAAAWLAACEGDVFPIQSGEEEVVTMGGSGGMGEPAPSSGGAMDMGGASSGGTVALGGMGGEPEPPRLVPLWNEPVRALDPAPDEDDADPCMSPNGLELYFNSTRGSAGREDIFRSTRATVDDAWGAPAPVMELNSASSEAGPFVLSDGLTIIFARHDTEFSLFTATRPTINDPWTTPVQLMGTEGTFVGLAPSVTSDGLKMYYSATGAGLDVDIFQATRGGLGDAFGPRQVVASLQTGDNDWDPVSQDDLVVYFNRSADLWGAVRTSTSEPFANLHPLTELNTEFNETDAWLSLDGKTLLFSSNRDGQAAIYEARRD